MPQEDMEFMPSRDLMTKDEIVLLAKKFVELGVTKIRLTGGEPLVRKDFDDIFKELSQLPVSLHLTTNGVTLHKHLSVLVAGGLKDINISLDTLQQGRFKALTRRDSSNIVLKNIRRCIDLGLKVKINTVLLKDQNDDEIIDLIEFTRENDVSLRFIEFMPFDKNDWLRSKTVSLDDILSVASERFSNIIPLTDHYNSTSKNFKIPGFKGDFGVISTVSAPFCDSCNRMRLTADGKMKNCLFASGEVDLLSVFRKGEELIPLIKTCVLSKKEARGGLVSQENFIEKGAAHKNRSMIAIGG